MTSIQIAVIAGVIAVAGTAHADDPWAPDDDFVEGNVAFATGVQTDATYVYAVGYGTGQNGYVAHVRRRRLTTNDWTTVDTYVGDGQARAQAVAVDTSTGIIYVAGTTYASPSSPSQWYVRTSKDHGAHWAMDHLGSVFVGGKNSVGGLRFNGTAIISIAATDTAGTTHWIVKTLATGWGTVDTFTPQGANTSAWPYRIAFNSNGQAMVVGWVLDSTGSHWMIRQNNGGSWGTINTQAGRAGEGLAQYSGVLYTTGMNLAGTHWITRRSTDSGMTWTDVDNVSVGTLNSGLQVRELSGVVYVCGIYNNLWAVRKSTDGTTWSESDSVATGAGTAADLNPGGGTMWVVGSVYDGAVDHWVVRALQP